MTSAELGRWGELVASRYLEGQGWIVVARNARAARGEIDLIARRGSTLAFCEVKTRSGADRFGHPRDAVHARKRTVLTRVARAWLLEHPQRVRTIRFDVISVLDCPDGPPVIEHLEDAWWSQQR